MKSIWYKQVVVIDGKEHVLSTCDYSQSIADLQADCGEMTDEEIVDSIKNDPN